MNDLGAANVPSDLYLGDSVEPTVLNSFATNISSVRNVSLNNFSSFESNDNKKLTRMSVAPRITNRYKSHFVKHGKPCHQRRSVNVSLIDNNFKIGFDMSFRRRQEMRNPSTVNRIGTQSTILQCLQ